MLGLDYGKYGSRARKIKHDMNSWRETIVTVTSQNGRPLKPLTSVHREEFRFREPVPVGFVALLEEKAVSERVGGAWYRSPNRNRQLEYFDDSVSIRVYPKRGTCRITPRRGLTGEQLRVGVEDAFCKALPARVFLDDAFKRMMMGLQSARRHRTFRIGPVTAFRNDFYKYSHGLRILADASHPEYLEVHEGTPVWIPCLFELQRILSSAIESNTRVVSDFALQIKSHLHVMKGIGKAIDLLNETIRKMNKTVDRVSILNNNEH